MESFSTRGLPAPRKVAYWNALSSETFAAMEIRPRNAARFDGELRREPVGPLTLLDVRSDAVRIRHTRSHALKADSPSYLLLTPLRGAFELHIERRRALDIHAGEFCLLDHAAPYELQHGDAVRVLCVDIPRVALGALLPQPDAAVGRLMRPDHNLSRLLVAVLRELGTGLEPDSSAQFAPVLAQGLLGFIAAAYAADTPDRAPGRTVRRRELLACIDARLEENTLTPDDIARAAKISTRRLRALLAEGDESFREYLLRRRLERCADLLRDAARRHQTLTHIAFQCGFNNATHFGFAFRQHFGLAPREYRARLQPGAQHSV